MINAASTNSHVKHTSNKSNISATNDNINKTKPHQIHPDNHFILELSNNDYK